MSYHSKDKLKKILYICTYSTEKNQLGGAAWINKEITNELSNNFEITVKTIENFITQSNSNIHIEIQKNTFLLFKTLIRMIFLREAYFVAKFRSSSNWKKAVDELLRIHGDFDLLITSESPSLLLSKDSKIRPDIHFVHNVDSILSKKFDPWYFKLLRNPKQTEIFEKDALSLPEKLVCLSRLDVKNLRTWGIYAKALCPTPESVVFTTKSFSRLGFIGKMTWPPNREGAKALINEIFPTITKKNPGTFSLTIAGRGSENFESSEYVSGLGEVSNLTAFYEKVDLLVVPRSENSTGVSVKLIEALTFGTPVLAPQELYEAIGWSGESFSSTSVSELTDCLFKLGQNKKADVSIKFPKNIHNINWKHELQFLLLKEFSKEREINEKFVHLFDRKPIIATQAELLTKLLIKDNHLRVQTINLSHLFLLRKNYLFRKAFNSANAITLDGMPMMLIGNGFQNRVTGSDFLMQLAHNKKFQDKKIGILGGSSLSHQYFEMALKGISNSLVFSETSKLEMWAPEDIVKELNVLDVDLLLISAPLPVGEIIGMELMDEGFSGNIINVGAGLAMLSGEEKRSPLFLQRLSLEWLYRFSQNPTKLFRRYFIEGPESLILLVRIFIHKQNSSK